MIAPCQACGLQVSIQAPACPRCGQPLPTSAAQAQASKSQQSAGLTLAVILAVCFGVLWYACNSYKNFSKEDDKEFCAQWLSYYEDLCKINPANCKEGPRKKARCQ